MAWWLDRRGSGQVLEDANAEGLNGYAYQNDTSGERGVQLFDPGYDPFNIGFGWQASAFCLLLSLLSRRCGGRAQ